LIDDEIGRQATMSATDVTAEIVETLTVTATAKIGAITITGVEGETEN
jgi:hypothetical protein